MKSSAIRLSLCISAVTVIPVLLIMKVFFYPRKVDRMHSYVHYEPLVKPISFSYPSSRFHTYKSLRRGILKASCFSMNTPRDGIRSSRQYPFSREETYMKDYARSYFSVTRKKAGWDCLRHYEILAAGSIPYFMDLSEIPESTMTSFPRHLVAEAMSLPGVPSASEVRTHIAAKSPISCSASFWTNETQSRYHQIRERLIGHLKQHMLTSKYPEHLSLPPPEVQTVWIQTYAVGIDYMVSMLCIGLVETGYRVNINTDVDYLFNDTSSNTSALYGMGFSITRSLSASRRSNVNMRVPIELFAKMKPRDVYIILAPFSSGKTRELEPLIYRKHGATLLVEGNDQFGEHDIPMGVDAAYRRELPSFIFRNEMKLDSVNGGYTLSQRCEHTKSGHRAPANSSKRYFFRTRKKALEVCAIRDFESGGTKGGLSKAAKYFRQVLGLVNRER